MKAFAALSQLVVQVHPAWSQGQSAGEGLNEPVQDPSHLWKAPEVNNLLMQ